MKDRKTKLGLSVAFVAALCWLIAYMSYTPLLLLVGYILLREEDQQLRRISVKSLLLSLCFSLVSMVLSVIPSTFRFFSNVIDLFGGHFFPEFLYDSEDVLNSLLSLGNLGLTMLLAIMALFGKDLPLGPLDKLADKVLGLVTAHTAPAAPAAPPVAVQQHQAPVVPAPSAFDVPQPAIPVPQPASTVPENQEMGQ